MHLLLTDRLTCPRCGPGFGLILRADRMQERDVVEGALGCPNCRDAFPVTEGFGDLRAPPRRTAPEGLAGPPAPRADDEVAGARIRALLGVAQGPGTIVLVGGPARYAEALARATEGVHVLAMDPDLRGWPPAAQVSRLMAGPGIPLFDGSMRAVAVDGRLGANLTKEAARVVARMGRVVVVHAGPDARETLAYAGLEVLAEESGTVVATRP